MIESMNLITCGSILATVFCLSGSMLCIKRQQQRKVEETQRIQLLQQKIIAVLQDDGQDAAREAFSVTLKTASLTTELQVPRLQNMAKVAKQPPEKYKILSKLASQGMDAEEIASILDISRMEAVQLLSLCNMAKCSQ